MSPVLTRILDWLATMTIDHGILRLIYANRFRLPGDLYRSNQPSGGAIVRFHELMRRSGKRLRTVVSLRGKSSLDKPYYRLERHSCDKLGIELCTTTIWSRGLLFKEQLLDLCGLIEGLELPALVHCKSGADRAGFFSVIYRHIRLGEPIEDAIKELSLRYGHASLSSTGILDHFFFEYLNSRKIRQGFVDWLRYDYDRESMIDHFSQPGIGKFFTDTILRRE